MLLEQVYAAIMGAVVADALGVPYEFSTKEQMQDNPAVTMTGYGTYNKEPGTWSDDSSLTLATMDSLINGINYDDLMRKFSLWYYESAYTANQDTFDIGSTTLSAILAYNDGNRSALECGGSDNYDNGNGSLMRITPVILYLIDKDYSIKKKRQIINNMSSVTHAHHVSKDSCFIFYILIEYILNNKDYYNFKELLKNGISEAKMYFNNPSKSFNKIFNELFQLDLKEIYSKGFVVDTLEVALYCCYHTTNYKYAVLMAVNTGGDTDTNALVTGTLAAIYYGYDNIPEEWINTILRKDYILDLCDKFYNSL